ncbi:MAG: TetR/AcrR family transcriptional regulator [Rhizomicrobium sp.]
MAEILKSAGKPARETEKSPRERILEAARTLFYAHGIRGVSVDEIAAAAQTNKMTLYRHFGSKDQLVADYLRLLSAEAEAGWTDLARAHPGDPEAQLQSWIGQTGEMLAKAGDRGCAVANAAVELPEKDHPARSVIEEHKTHQRDHLAALCRDAGFAKPEQLADEIFLLLEGARINMQSVGRDGPGARIAQMLCATIKAHPRS